MGVSIQSGTAISHYRVISPLGSGGMGEVYLAQDLTLERAVALKILPPELTKNEERVRRFVQEAKSASSLSHPHIVTIYEIGQAEVRPGDAPEAVASSGAGVHFIAMELISGDTLKHQIHHEKADLRTLLRYLAQAAEGLAKAHAAGIVHRDLKPDNIMITKEGYAKILDFGLAKLTERKESADGATSALTATRERTREGAVMGTVGYMSPEQVQGKAVDHRSDIFSFGCILYEAATRAKPFAADSDVEIMHRILRDKPAPIEESSPTTPAELRRVIRRCLAKAPDQRLQSMKDLAIELNEIVEEFDDLSLSSDSRTPISGSSPPALAATPAPGRRFHPGIIAAVAVGIVGIALGIYGLLRRAPASAAASAPFQTMKMTRLTTSGKVQNAALSPDGRYVANVVKEAGKYSLWIRQVATGSDVRIVEPLPTPFRGVSFSPDGNYVYYINQETVGPGYSILYQIPFLGGPARKVLFDIDTAASFSPDGKKLAFMRGYPQSSEYVLMVAGADGTGEQKLAIRKPPDEFALLAPAWSPDGRRIAAIVNDQEKGAASGVVEVAVSDGRQKPIGDAEWIRLGSLVWLPDGSSLAVTGVRKGGLLRQAWLLSYPAGEIRRVSNDLSEYDGISVTADSKALAATRTNTIANLWVAPAGNLSSTTQITFGSENQDAIRDVAGAGGDSIVFAVAEADSVSLWSIAADGGRRTRLTQGTAFNFGPAVSPGGNVIAFTSTQGNSPPHIWKMDLDGGNPSQVTKGEGERLLALSPDARWLLYVTIKGSQIWKIPIEGGAPVKIVETSLGAAAFSPDGRLIACETFVPKGNRLERAMQVFPSQGGPAIHTIPFPDGLTIRWTPTGDGLTYTRETDGVSNIWKQPLDGTPPKPITDSKTGQIFSYDWSPDGRHLILSRGQVTSDVILITDFR
ncbi:MAG TPA: protein kinase [Candidatus Polarisedimenticolia bacterium]|jgi:serine/threonine protein kinase|nr:protein kinase [Candidatus Polarisedimenticolia bacterium]